MIVFSPFDMVYFSNVCSLLGLPPLVRRDEFVFSFGLDPVAIGDRIMCAEVVCQQQRRESGRKQRLPVT
jgi:hypothetical protein